MTRNLLIIATAVLGVSITATPAAAGHIRIEHVADRLVDDLEDLGEEFRDDYRHAPEYRALIATMLDMHSLAVRVERVADCRGSLAKIDADVCALERLLPRLKSLVAGVHCHNLYGATRRVARELDDIAEGICELREEVNELKYKVLHKPAPVIHHQVTHHKVIHHKPVVHGHGHGHAHAGVGIRLGKGGPTVTFGRGGIGFCFGR